MSNRARIERFKRVIKTLKMLQQVQIDHHIEANSKRRESSSAANELDKIDLQTSPAWAMFDKNWLTYRATLDKKLIKYAREEQNAKLEAKRLEKAIERYSMMITDIDATETKKQAFQDTLEYIANSNSVGKSALCKIDLIKKKPDNN